MVYDAIQQKSMGTSRSYKYTALENMLSLVILPFLVARHPGNVHVLWYLGGEAVDEGGYVHGDLRAA